MNQNRNRTFSSWRMLGEIFGNENVAFFLKLAAGGMTSALGQDARFMVLLERFDPQYKKLLGLFKSHMAAAVANIAKPEIFEAQVAAVDGALEEIATYVFGLQGNLPSAIKCFKIGEEQIAEHAAKLDGLGYLGSLANWSLARFEEHFDKPTALVIWLRITMDAQERAAWKREHRIEIRTIRGTAQMPKHPTVPSVVMPVDFEGVLTRANEMVAVVQKDGALTWVSVNGNGEPVGALLVAPIGKIAAMSTTALRKAFKDDDAALDFVRVTFTKPLPAGKRTQVEKAMNSAKKPQANEN